jgi:hypothetical protein
MLRMRAFQNPSLGFEYEFYIWDADNRAAVKEIVFIEQSPSTRMQSAFSLDKGCVQELMDSLWMLGIRPSEGVASTGQVEAMQAHLADMRKLAFGLLTHELHYPGVNNG